MNKRDKVNFDKLSVRAKKMYKRLCEGEHYPNDYTSPGPVMQELLDAGLVHPCGRWVEIRSFYVPKGFRTNHPDEKFPKYPG